MSADARAPACLNCREWPCGCDPLADEMEREHWRLRRLETEITKQISIVNTRLRRRGREPGLRPEEWIPRYGTTKLVKTNNDCGRIQFTKDELKIRRRKGSR